jgi:hypothetical protein
MLWIDCQITQMLLMLVGRLIKKQKWRNLSISCCLVKPFRDKRERPGIPKGGDSVPSASSRPPGGIRMSPAAGRAARRAPVWIGCTGRLGSKAAAAAGCTSLSRWPRLTQGCSAKWRRTEPLDGFEYLEQDAEEKVRTEKDGVMEKTARWTSVLILFAKYN